MQSPGCCWTGAGAAAPMLGCLPLCTSSANTFRRSCLPGLPPPVPCHLSLWQGALVGIGNSQCKAMEVRDTHLSSLCHIRSLCLVFLPFFSQVGSKEKSIFLRNRLFVLEGFCSWLLTSLNCITLRYASDLHSLNPALFDYICHYSN